MCLSAAPCTVVGPAGPAECNVFKEYLCPCVVRMFKCICIQGIVFYLRLKLWKLTTLIVLMCTCAPARIGCWVHEIVGPTGRAGYNTSSSQYKLHSYLLPLAPYNYLHVSFSLVSRNTLLPLAEVVHGWVKPVSPVQGDGRYAETVFGLGLLVPDGASNSSGSVPELSLSCNTSMQRTILAATSRLFPVSWPCAVPTRRQMCVNRLCSSKPATPAPLHLRH
mmetsp:Transcript_40837/g.73134  ORF Transcript_40837/g.73134 Transcript_40837/m.73134 type:complete len:221 (+) Transcript_40837:580-1242(+)